MIIILTLVMIYKPDVKLMFGQYTLYYIVAMIILVTLVLYTCTVWSRWEVSVPGIFMHKGWAFNGQYTLYYIVAMIIWLPF